MAAEQAERAVRNPGQDAERAADRWGSHESPRGTTPHVCLVHSYIFRRAGKRICSSNRIHDMYLVYRGQYHLSHMYISPHNLYTCKRK